MDAACGEAATGALLPRGVRAGDEECAALAGLLRADLIAVVAASSSCSSNFFALEGDGKPSSSYVSGGAFASTLAPTTAALMSNWTCSASSCASQVMHDCGTDGEVEEYEEGELDDRLAPGDVAMRVLTSSNVVLIRSRALSTFSSAVA